jgi:hypothetical protein
VHLFQFRASQHVLATLEDLDVVLASFAFFQQPDDPLRARLFQPGIMSTLCIGVMEDVMDSPVKCNLRLSGGCCCCLCHSGLDLVGSE